MTGTYSLRAIHHDTTGDTIVEWDGCIVGVRVSSPEEAHAVGAIRHRVTTCPLTFGAYGGCVRRAQHTGQCADAHGNRYDGRLMTGSTMRYLSVADRRILGLCVDCAGTGVWDDDTTCPTCHGWGEPSDDIVAVVERYDRRARAASMAAHPAGKGRTVKIGGRYPRNVNPVNVGYDPETRRGVAEVHDLMFGALYSNPWNV